jgi:osmotically-inducible protein OsmY
VIFDEGRDVEADAELAQLVAERFVGDPELTRGHVRITVQNRVVILQGYVYTPEARLAAARLAWSTPGVFDVCNRLARR